MKRLTVVLFMSVTLFSCQEFSSSEETGAEIILELDSSNMINLSSDKLYPILNKFETESFKLKSEVQNGTSLKLEFDIELEAHEELHYTINNGDVVSASQKILELDLLEGNNVVFVCISSTIGISSNFWVKNYFVGEGEGSFDSSKPHLFHHLTSNNEGAVIDYQVMNNGKDFSVLIEVDSSSYKLTPTKPYFLQSKRPIRLQLHDSNGNLVDGPFNDTGVREH